MHIRIMPEPGETKLDWVIILLVLLFAVFSVVSIASATQTNFTGDARYFYVRQIIWYAVGAVAAFLTAHMDYHVWLKKWNVLYVSGIGALVLIFLWGTVTHGANSWFSFGPFKLEPAEFMKIILILSLSKWLAGDEPEKKRRQLARVRDLSVPLGLTGLPCLLVLLQPDLGMALMMSAVAAGILYVGGIRRRPAAILLGGLLAGAGILVLIYHYRQPWFFHIIHEYQWHRLTSFVDPESHKDNYGYQVYQSMLAVGGGQFFGQGLFKGLQTQGGLVPERHTDFIFAVFSEETGFAGSALLMLLYAVLLYRMSRIAAHARDLEGTLIVAGVISMFLAQLFENIGMTISLMPITGITLPLMSYGGSSILTTLISIGLVLGVGRRSKEGWFA